MSLINSLTQKLLMQSSFSSQKSQLGVLQQQISTGRISDNFAGLSSTVGRQSISLRGQIDRLAAYSQGIGTLAARAQSIENSYTQINTVLGGTDTVPGLLGNAITLSTTQSDGGAALRAQSTTVLQQVVSYLSTSIDGSPLFSGQANNTSNATSYPIQDSTTIINGVTAALSAQPPPQTPAEVTQRINEFFDGGTVSGTGTTTSLASGSTVQSNQYLTPATAISSGTTLAKGSVLAAGTVLTDSITTASGTIAAGTTLTTAQTLTAATTLTGSLTAPAGSSLGAGTVVGTAAITGVPSTWVAASSPSFQNWFVPAGTPGTPLTSTQAQTAYVAGTAGAAVPIADGQTAQVSTTAQPTVDFTTGQITGNRGIRDILASVATLAVVSPTNINLGTSSNDATAYQNYLVQLTSSNGTISTTATTTQSLNLHNALTIQNAQVAANGQVRKQIDNQLQYQKALTTVVNTNLNNVEAVDSAKAITDLQALSTQLQASYQVTAQLRSLNLFNYIT